MIVGLTGGIGSGKTTILKMFEKLGVPIYIADVESKKIMKKEPVKSEIIDLLGDMAYLGEEINTAFISEKVFNDKLILKKLNEIIHPAVRKDFLNFSQNSTYKYVINETAILFESGVGEICDKIISVIAPEETRIKRVVSRDKCDEKDVKARMNNQVSDQYRIENSDFVIRND